MVAADGKVTVTGFRLRKRPFANATDSSWLALVDPAAAEHAPLAYGDVVNLKGKVITEQDQAGKSEYLVHLDHRISVPASAGDPAEKNVEVIRLLGFDEFPSTSDVYTTATYDVDGTLSHSRTNQGPALTLRVHGFGYGHP